MKYIISLFVLLFLFLPVKAYAGSLIPPECTPQVVDDIKQIVCPQGTQLTQAQTVRIQEINQRILEKQAQTQERIEVKEQKIETIQEKKQLQQQNIEEGKQQRVRTYYSLMHGRIEAYIDRLFTLLTRIQNRLDTLENEGEDVSELTSNLQEAEDLLVEAKAELETAKTNLETDLESGDAKTAFQNLQESTKLIKDNLREIKMMLVDMIGTIRGLKVGQY